MPATEGSLAGSSLASRHLGVGDDTPLLSSSSSAAASECRHAEFGLLARVRIDKSVSVRRAYPVSWSPASWMCAASALKSCIPVSVDVDDRCRSLSDLGAPRQLTADARRAKHVIVRPCDRDDSETHCACCAHRFMFVPPSLGRQRAFKQRISPFASSNTKTTVEPVMPSVVIASHG
jgi:hypothetical protein